MFVSLKKGILYMKKYGYARVSTKGQAMEGNSLENQKSLLLNAGAEEIFTDVFTGTTTDRPEFDKLLSIIMSGDELVVTKLDRIARTVEEGSVLIKSLLDKDITVRILNFGTLDSTPNGKLMYHIFLSFAEFERDMIYERCQGGRAYKRASDPSYREGRKKKYSEERIQAALEYRSCHSISETVKATGISKATLLRMQKSIKALNGKTK
jgi:DNA invertase Pin-like site-specific DNA recombinase